MIGPHSQLDSRGPPRSPTADYASLDGQFDSILGFEPHPRIDIFTNHSPSASENAIEPSHANSKTSSV
ncbi:hypothetical protein BDW69DRAFT_176056 [Aspergillus filifer]